MSAETIFILLFVVAMAVAIVVQRLAIPYTVALVLTGLLLGGMHVIETPHLTKALLFDVFLPGLLFEAAFHIDFKQFWQNRLAITSLALPGVVAAIILTVVILTPLINHLESINGFLWQYALVFGALISATDPIAVMAVFRSLGVPKRLSTLLDGESLLNDGVAIVLFTLSLALVAGTEVTIKELSFDFIKIVGIGGLIGAGIGIAVTQVMRHVDDPTIEVALTMITAYGSFFAAEHFHYSGVIAVVVASMLCGNYATRIGMSPSTKIAVETFWEYMAFVLNSVVFLLIGLEVNFQGLLASWQAILVAYFVVMGTRALVIFGVSSFLRMTRERIPWTWSMVLTWGGLRGGIPMVLVLALPNNFPYRDLLVSMTFGVVILSILVHGLTMSPILRWLGIIKKQQERMAYELMQGKLQSTRAALDELNRMSHIHFTNPRVLTILRNEYEQALKRNSEIFDKLHFEKEQLQIEELKRVRRHILLVEKNEVKDAFHRGLINRAVHEKLLADIDAKLIRLESQKFDEEIE